MTPSTVLYMSMSLDGFIAGPNEGPGNGLGDGGDRLHEWVFAGSDAEENGMPGRPAGVNGELYDEFMSTGAVVAGLETVEPAGFWGGDHHDGVPIFILSREHDGTTHPDFPLVTFVGGVEELMTKAKQAAGDRNVLVHGATVTQLALGAGALDEIQLHVVPVIFGQGRRLFDNLDAEQIELERTRVLEGEGGVIHERYSVKR